MIGLEFITKSSDMNYSEVANELGISRKTINDWVKGRSKIPKKRLTQLSELFDLPEELFGKELNEIDQLEIQKIMLERKSKPVIEQFKQTFSLEESDIVDEPIFDNDEMNNLILKIEKTKILADFQKFLKSQEDDRNILLLQQLIKMLQNNIDDPIFQNTTDVLSHYYKVLPDWVGRGITEAEFEEELISVFEKYKDEIE